MLRTDTLYIVDDQYVRTPDGVGAYWYQDEDEARGDVEPVVYVETLNVDEFDLLRDL